MRGHRRGDQIVPVIAAKVANADVPVYLNGVGTVQAFNTAVVRTQVSGRLIDVPYTEGQDVKEGDVLAKVDPSLYQAAYDQVVAQKAKDEALLANARLDQKRYADLVKTSAASQQQADTATSTVHQYEAAVKLDQALIDNAQANLQWTTIRAPFAGKTGIRLLDKGNLVSSQDQTGIVVITQLNPIAVVFTLPENTVSGVIDASNRGPVRASGRHRRQGNRRGHAARRRQPDRPVDGHLQDQGHIPERAEPSLARSVRECEAQAEGAERRDCRSLRRRAGRGERELCLSRHA